jgi:hypothetical protein
MNTGSPVSRRCVLQLTLLGVFRAAAVAQRKGVRGVVHDRDGKPVKGAAVKLKNLRTLRFRSYITQEDGAYHFFDLNPNFDYQVQASFRGRASEERILERFDSKPVVIADLRIE